MTHLRWLSKSKSGGLIAALGDPKDKDTDAFRMFKRQLYHTSVSTILEPIKPAMEAPQVMRCSDSHFRRTVFGVGPNTMDYPEQAQAACVVEGWCPVYVHALYSFACHLKAS